VRGVRGTPISARSRFAITLAVLCAFLAGASAAGASEKLTTNASNVRIRVDAAGHAVVYYTRGGRRFHPVVWGAVNARDPNPSVRQVSFRIDYSGGFNKLGHSLWRTIRNRCRPYRGPRLAWFVTGCTAPDGSHWALQRFQRLLPNLGLNPWLPRQRAWELHISHWTGEPAKLEVYADWVMSSRWHELFGRLTYRGRPVHGFRYTSAGAPLDGYGRLIYLDTFNSALGPGWRRENSFGARRPDGHFCYHFLPRDRYAGYPAGPTRPAAHGDRYRVTAGGPGVTTFVATQVLGLPSYDASNSVHAEIEVRMNAMKRSVVGADAGCFTD
jgi:hypothetical protein